MGLNQCNALTQNTDLEFCSLLLSARLCELSNYQYCAEHHKWAPCIKPAAFPETFLCEDQTSWQLLLAGTKILVKLASFFGRKVVHSGEYVFSVLFYMMHCLSTRLPLGFSCFQCEGEKWNWISASLQTRDSNCHHTVMDPPNVTWFYFHFMKWFHKKSLILRTMASLSAKFQREGQSQSPRFSYFSSIRSIKDLIIAPGRDRHVSITLVIPRALPGRTDGPLHELRWWLSWWW